jgi:hypothetical protein
MIMAVVVVAEDDEDGVAIAVLREARGAKEEEEAAIDEDLDALLLRLAPPVPPPLDAFMDAFMTPGIIKGLLFHLHVHVLLLLLVPNCYWRRAGPSFSWPCFRTLLQGEESESGFIICSSGLFFKNKNDLGAKFNILFRVLKIFD